jgi:hypothetical protein
MVAGGVHILKMDTVLRLIAGVALGLGLITGLPVPAAQAACLPGQTCWQPPQLQSTPLPTVRDDSMQQQVQQDRTAVMQNQQQLTTDRTQLRMPLGNVTPLDRIQQRQQLRTDHQQLLQSQQSLQQSQQLLLNQQRPPAPTPYVIRPLGGTPLK